MRKENLWWRRYLPAPWIPGVCLILAMGGFATPALAHRVLIYAYAEGDTIHTESTFVPDTPVRQGKILVIDNKTDKVLLTGQTDDQGKFSFKIPAAAAAHRMDLLIVVEAAMGHRGEWLLKADSYLAGLSPGKTAATAAAAAPGPAPSSAAPGTKAVNLDRQMLEEALNKALERQLAPIKEKLTQLTIHRTSLSDIIGGIGYILGLFGLWAYFQSKRIKNS
jgi:nickel transport protein